MLSLQSFHYYDNNNSNNNNNNNNNDNNNEEESSNIINSLRIIPYPTSTDNHDNIHILGQILTLKNGSGYSPLDMLASVKNRNARDTLRVAYLGGVRSLREHVALFIIHNDIRGI